MALSEDQKAMLRLLAQRGEQGYEDIAALKGASVDEVRAQVKEAVARLEAEGLPPPALPPPPQVSDPPTALTPPPTPPPAPAPPVEPRPAVAAEAEAAKPRAAPSPAAPQQAKARFALPKLRRISLPSNPAIRGALAAAATALVIVLAIVLIDGGREGEDSTSAGGAAAGETSGGSTNAANSEGSGSEGSGEEMTQAILRSVDGASGSGVAVFGRVKKKLALQVEAQGLEPTGRGESYTVWLAASPQEMLPLAYTQVSGKGRNAGRISAQFEAPTEVLSYLANETFGEIVLTRTDNQRLTASLKKATNREESPEYTGTRVLEGTVTGPVVGAALREEEQKGG